MLLDLGSCKEDEYGLKTSSKPNKFGTKKSGGSSKGVMRMNIRHKGLENNKLFLTIKPKKEESKGRHYMKLGNNKTRSDKDPGSSVSS